MQIVSTIGLITINATMVVQLVSFLLFLLVINQIMIRPLRRLMGERETLLSRLADQIAGAREKFDAVNSEIEQQEERARKDANQVRTSLESAGDKAAEQVIQQTMEQIRQLRHEAQQKIDVQMAEMRQSVEQEAEAVALAMMETILQRRLSA